MKSIFTVVLLSGLLLGCAGKPVGGDARLCSDGLEIAERELSDAQARGFGETVDYTRAVSLLGAAKIQREFGKYPNCIDKVERARHYIGQIGRGE